MGNKLLRSNPEMYHFQICYVYDGDVVQLTIDRRHVAVIFVRRREMISNRLSVISIGWVGVCGPVFKF